MLSKAVGTIVLGLALGVCAAGMGGCGAGAASGVGAAGVNSPDPLNQLTADATVNGFQDFAGSAADAGAARLSEEQLAQIEDLQAQRDAGTIGPEEFETRVHDIMGDAAPDRAFAGFGFFGAPFGGFFNGHRADVLQLTDEQRAQALDIFIALHDDIHALRTDARDQILALLTVEQRARLLDLQLSPPGRRVGQRHGHPGRGRGPDHPVGLQRAFERLAERLELTEAQQTQIQTILTQLRADIAARHAEAREAFRALLTEDQLALLDTLEVSRPHEDDALDSEETETVRR
jgi:Spy/CpxP family protein refolding chaperone